VEILTYNTFTNIGSNLTPFDNISKSGDGGHGGIFYIPLLPLLKPRRKIMMLMISNRLTTELKERDILKLKLDVSIV
jgi:hypothetical protein